MTENGSTPADGTYSESATEKIKNFFWVNGMYIAIAGIAIAAWLLFGMTALAFTATGLVFIAVSIVVGAMSENVWRGLLTGVVAALPVALFFLWILK